MNNLQIVFIIIGLVFFAFGVSGLLKFFKGYGLLGVDRTTALWWPKLGFFRTTKTNYKFHKVRLLVYAFFGLFIGLFFLLMSFAKY